MSKYVHEEDGSVVSLPWIRPSSLLLYLLTSYQWLLLGGCEVVEQAEAMLQSFWDNYKVNHPSHTVFNRSPLPLKRTIPVALHGDGARTQKMQPLEIFSLEAVLGVDSYQCKECRHDPCGCPQTKKRRKQFGDPLVQCLNQKHHSYLTRFLLFAFASKELKMPGLLRALLQQVGDDLGKVCEEGIQTPHGRWGIAVVGYKGDMEYHAKTSISRSYANVGHVNFIRCCHECEAGHRNHPFEDPNPAASWVSTRYTTLPWVTMPPFTSIPFEDWSGDTNAKAALFFRRDSFHIFRLGIGRNFVASCIILMCHNALFDDGESDYSMERRMKTAWSHFYLWCSSTGQRPQSIRSFTRDKLHFKRGSFPYVSCKGSDTVLLLKWLIFIIELTRKSVENASLKQTLGVMLLGARSGLVFTQYIHRHGLWMRKHCVGKLRLAVKRFLHCYSVLAKESLDNSISLFGMVPKYHSMAHYIADIDDFQARNQGDDVLLLNPACFDCSMNEDFVGAVAKQSRRIGYRCLLDNLFLAYKVKLRFVIKRYMEKKGKRS